MFLKKLRAFSECVFLFYFFKVCPKNQAESLLVKHFRPCWYLPLKQPNHTFDTQRGGIKKSIAFLFSLALSLYISPILRTSPKNLPSSFSQATSVISAEPTQHPQSILLIVLPQMPLFWIISHGTHSLCMASRQNDTSEQNATRVQWTHRGQPVNERITDPHICAFNQKNHHSALVAFPPHFFVRANHIKLSEL